MAMKMKSNDDVSSASVDGVMYEPDADGVFSVSNMAHAHVLAAPPFNFEMLSDDDEVAAEVQEDEADAANEPPADEEAEAVALAAKIEALKAVDPLDMANRGVVVKWLAENGDTESKSSEDRDDLNAKVIALRDKLVAELEAPVEAAE